VQHRAIMHDFLFHFGALVDDWAERSLERIARWPEMTAEERVADGVNTFDSNRVEPRRLVTTAGPWSP
jgi:hypothetical protein